MDTLIRDVSQFLKIKSIQFKLLMLLYLKLSKFHSSSDIKNYQVLIIPMNHGQCVGFELSIVPPKKSTILCILLF
jgi:hypothetical protein